MLSNMRTYQQDCLNCALLSEIRSPTCATNSIFSLRFKFFTSFFRFHGDGLLILLEIEASMLDSLWKESRDSLYCY